VLLAGLPNADEPNTEAAVVAVAATGVLLTELVAGPVPPKTFCPNGDAAVDAAPLTLPNKLGPPEPVDD